MNSYFQQTKYKSFQRQLNFYGFTRIQSGKTKGSYAHKLFLRDKPDEAQAMFRQKGEFRVVDPPTNQQIIPTPPNGMFLSSLEVESSSLESIGVDPQLLKLQDDELLYGHNMHFDAVSETDGVVEELIGGLFEGIETDILFRWQSDDEKMNRRIVQASSEAGFTATGNSVEDGGNSMPIKSLPTLKPPDGPNPLKEYSFPWKLHDMLDDAENKQFQDIVSWESDGISFKVRQINEFVDKVLPLYFDQTKFESFRRQLNVYGFTRVSRGPNQGSYVHICFTKADRSLCRLVRRQNARWDPLHHYYCNTTIAI